MNHPAYYFMSELMGIPYQVTFAMLPPICLN